MHDFAAEKLREVTKIVDAVALVWKVHHTLLGLLLGLLLLDMPPSGLHAMRKLLGIKPQEADVLLESAAKCLLRKVFDRDQVVCVPEMVHLRYRKFKWLL